MVKEVYNYTENMPSGNPFTWYYDNNQQIAFGTSLDSCYWSKIPNIGDTITYFKSGNYNEITDRVLINNEIVFQRNEEIESVRSENERRYYENLIIETKKRLGTL